MPVIVGGVFTALTASTNASLALFTPSLTLTVIVASPVCPAAGLTVTVRLAPLPPKTMLLVGTSVAFDEFLLNVRLPTGVSTSPTVKLNGPVELFTLIVWFAMLDIVGGSFTALTVTTKIVLTLYYPSLPLTV